MSVLKNITLAFSFTLVTIMEINTAWLSYKYSHNNDTLPLHSLFSRTYVSSHSRQVAVPSAEMSHFVHPVPQPEKRCIVTAESLFQYAGCM